MVSTDGAVINHNIWKMKQICFLSNNWTDFQDFWRKKCPTYPKPKEQRHSTKRNRKKESLLIHRMSTETDTTENNDQEI